MVKDYLISKINKISEKVRICEDVINFVYKNMSFIVLYVENDFPIFFLKSEEAIMYPHVILLNEESIDNDKYSYICLFESESIAKHLLSDEEKIDYAVDQFIKLFDLNEREIAKEIHREYKYHWNKLYDVTYISMIPYCNDYRDVAIYKYKKKDSKDIQNVVVSKSFPYDASKYSITIENCIYLSLNDISGIVPPSIEEWDNKKLKDLFFNLKRNRISYDDYERINKIYVKDKLTLLFRVPEYDYFEFGLKVIFSDENKKTFRKKIELNEISDIKLIKIDNQTIENSLYRNGQLPSQYKKVVLIGVGALGSYIANELVNQGVKELTLIDDDNLTNDNISRHYLGYEAIGMNKAMAMNFMLSFCYPYLKIKSINKRISKSNIKEILDDIDADLFIVATGNEDTELLINNYMSHRKRFVPTFFCWLEANGIGSHIFCLNKKEAACFECLLDQEINFIKNPFNYKVKNGCGGTYTKYGKQIILETVSMLIPLLNDNSDYNSCLYSYKGDFDGIDIGNLTDYYLSLDKGVTKIDVHTLQGCNCND